MPFPSSFASRLTTDALRPFPDRQLAFQFRSVNLEQLYRTQLARGVFPTNVNPEGSVIWVSEYLRYPCVRMLGRRLVLADSDADPRGRRAGPVFG